MPRRLELDRRAFLAGLAGVGVSTLARAQDGWIPPPPDRELRIPVRGGQIYARLNGDLKGPRAPVVFAHGGPGGNHAGFLATVALANERAVILYDQLDSGLSDRPNDPANWTVERFVSEVDALRAAFDLPRLHFVGHSWGSTIGLEYAARQPAGLKSVTFGSPLISTKSWQKSTLADLAKLPPDVVRTINDAEASGATDSPAYEKAMETFYARYMTRAPTPAYFGAYAKARGLKVNETIYQGMWGPGEIRATGILRTYDGEPLLPKVAAPALFVCGQFDEMTADVLQPMAAKVRDAKLVVIPGAGHGLPSTHSPAYVAALREHLNAHDA
jgi:proline iminopeptidase/L-proline amide hydrolase